MSVTAFPPRHDLSRLPPGLMALMARVPALVLWGDLDPYLDKGLAERFHAARVHHFPHNGHWLPVEDPERVAAHLLALFD